MTEKIIHLESDLTLVLKERLLTTGDIPVLVQFDIDEEYQYNTDTPPDHQAPPLTEEDFRQAFSDPNQTLTGIYDNDQLIAFYWLESKPDQGELYISAIIVHHNYRDKGIGGYCLDKADKEASSEGLEKLALTVDPLNGRGVHSYLRHGYQVTDYHLNHWGENAHRLFMEKQPNHPTRFSNESKEVLCKDDTAILSAIADGFIGIGLTRGSTNYDNQILFTKKNKQ